jgi:hypothetical protein
MIKRNPYREVNIHHAKQHSNKHLQDGHLSESDDESKTVPSEINESEIV